ncbi:MAG: 4Fe-4S binding protein [Pleomorphochaeta sp.]
MSIEVDKNRCPQNHPCPVVRVCPTKAIIQKGYAAPYIDKEKCIDCGRCIRFCGYGAFKRA